MNYADIELNEETISRECHTFADRVDAVIEGDDAELDGIVLSGRQAEFLVRLLRASAKEISDLGLEIQTCRDEQINEYF